MGSISGADIDAHLCDGGIVVAASDRAARAAIDAFQRTRRAEGQEAWFAPRIMAWQSFVRDAWQERTIDPRLLLNSLQEQSLWEKVIADNGGPAAVLQGPRRNLAAMALHAHALLCLYAPRFLDARTRGSWEQDSAAFSRWLTAFETLCRNEGVISQSLLPLESVPLLASDTGPRPPLLLTGFDRLLPVQENLFDAWGQWRHAHASPPADVVRLFVAPDPGAELTACAAWCKQRLTANPQSRILLVSQEVRERRGEFERASFRDAASDRGFRFEFSLGVPLSQTPPVRSATMFLRWLDSDLAESEVDWLFSTPYAATPSESADLQRSMRALRNRSMQRTRWKLQAFLNQKMATSPLPAAWAQRMRAAQQHLREVAQRELSPMEWAENVPHILEIIGWPGTSTTTSAEFQVVRRWQQALESCASLGFDGRRMKWQAFLFELLRVTDETLFAPESEEASILITGPAESAGITADAVWFLGVNDDAWPAPGDLHPFLPADLQRRARMPHCSPQVDWDLARTMTIRLLASAPEVYFSHPHSSEGVEMLPSRLVSEFTGEPIPLPRELMPTPPEPPRALAAEDKAAISFRTTESDGHVSIHPRGGAGLLTHQSQCPFKAFAIGRLGASSWQPAENALTPAERGKLLHDVLHSVWGGPPHGIRSLHELQNIADLGSFVDRHVDQVFSSRTLTRVRDEIPSRYFELEAMRLTRLITEWLKYESTRANFEVTETERDRTRTIGGLTLDLRLDRLDRLNDGSLLVVDYKTGDVSPSSWDLPRPEDVQLPLYAGFGLEEGDVVGGLVFAKIRAGDMCFAGRVVDPCSTLDGTLRSTSSLVKNPMSAEQLMDWRDAIEQLAHDFVAGRADVDPRDASKTCARCGLHTVCRIQEREPVVDEAEADVSNE